MQNFGSSAVALAIANLISTNTKQGRAARPPLGPEPTEVGQGKSQACENVSTFMLGMNNRKARELIGATGYQ